MNDGPEHGFVETPRDRDSQRRAETEARFNSSWRILIVGLFIGWIGVGLNKVQVSVSPFWLRVAHGFLILPSISLTVEAL